MEKMKRLTYYNPETFDMSELDYTNLHYYIAEAIKKRFELDFNVYDVMSNGNPEELIVGVTTNRSPMTPPSTKFKITVKAIKGIEEKT